MTNHSGSAVPPAANSAAGQSAWRYYLAPATLVLVAVCLGYFALTAIQAGSVMENDLAPSFNWGALIGPLVADEPWRVLTSAFLHFGPVHLIVNLISLVLVGASVERMLGALWYLTIVLNSVLAASLAVILFAPISRTVGISGALFGLLGAVLLLVFYLKESPRLVLVMLVVNLGLGFAVPSISLDAHIGGLLGGLVTAGIALLATRQANADYRRSGRLRYAFGRTEVWALRGRLAAAVVLVGLVFAIYVAAQDIGLSGVYTTTR